MRIFSRIVFAIASLWLLSTCSLAQEVRPDTMPDAIGLVEREEAAFQAAAALGSGCVVQIETFGGLDRVESEIVSDGPTTGTVIDQDGWIISSLYSLRRQPASILVALPDGTRVPARLVARDYSRELALLKIEINEKSKELGASVSGIEIANPAELASIQVGQWVVALGKTYSKEQVSQSVGIISALDRAYGRAVQTDAKISPINYGGPLVDLSGKVIGILAPISPGSFFEGDSSELYDSGIGFAIPLSDILTRLPGLKSGEDVRPGKLGIVSSDQNEFAGPVRLTGATPGSPAAKAGLRAGDIIVAAGNRKVSILADLRHALAQRDAGQSIELTIERDQQELEVACELVSEIPVYRRRYLGLRVAEQDSKVTIADIEDNSPASRTTTLQIGDRIVACDGFELKSKLDFIKKIAVAELDRPLKLSMVRGAESSEQKLEIELSVEEWPRDLPQELPAMEKSLEADGTEIVELKLGDLPNTCFALVPQGSYAAPRGLVLLFPEPGEVSQKRIEQIWGKFCSERQWIVAVAASANPQAWTRDEIELADRIIGRLENSYSVDSSRTVIGGLGVGGRMAMVAAAAQRQKISGVLTIGTEFRQLSLKEANAPMQSLDFLLVGDEAKLTSINETLDEAGYAANLVASPALDTSKWETVPVSTIQLWLEGLGRL